MRDDLDKIEPYHCVACGKQYNWELDVTDADLNFIDDDDPESTPLDTLDLAEQVQNAFNSFILKNLDCKTEPYVISQIRAHLLRSLFKCYLKTFYSY